MARIELAPAALEDFDRFVRYLQSFGSSDPAGQIADILGEIEILQRNPLIGRPVRDGHRELVIGRGAHGYVALYRFEPAIDTVLILGVRSQRELGFGEGR